MKRFERVWVTAGSALGVSALSLQVVYAAGAGEIQSKINSALQTIQTILTGIVVVVAICVTLWLIIKKLPYIDDPHVKNELFRGVGTIMAALAIAAAAVWVLPWVYSMFS